MNNITSEKTMKYNPYSYSKIQLYDRCPLAFKYRYIMEPDTNYVNTELQVGSALHRFVEEYQKHLLKNNIESDQETGKKMIEHISSLYLRIEVRKDILDVGMEMIEWFSLPPSTEIDSILFEEKVALDSDLLPVEYDDKKALIRGKIDRHEITKKSFNESTRETKKLLIVSDYKFWQKPVVEIDFQLKLYAYILWKNIYMRNVRENVNLKRSGFSIDDVNEISENIVIRTLNPRYGNTSDSGTFSIEEIEIEVKEYLKKIKVIESDTCFNPKIGNNCVTCEFKKNCEPLQKQQGLEKMIIDYILEKRKFSELERHVKAYVRENGNVEIDGSQFGEYNKDCFSWSGDDAIDYFNDIEPDIITKNFKINNTNMKKLIKKYDLNKEEIYEMAKNKPTKNFGFIE